MKPLSVWAISLHRLSDFMHWPSPCWTRAIPSLAQTVPQFHHAEAGVAAAHVPNQFQLRLRMLVGMAVGPPGLTGQGLHGPVPAGLPEVDVRTAFVVLPAGPTLAVFFRVLYQGLPVCHVLCYTLSHEGYGPLSFSCCLTTPTITDEALSFILFYSTVQDVLYSYTPELPEIG